MIIQPLAGIIILITQARTSCVMVLTTVVTHKKVRLRGLNVSGDIGEPSDLLVLASTQSVPCE